LFDIVFYANGLFSATVLDALGITSSNPADEYQELINVSKNNIYLALIGSIECKK
jgi:hypothetical protein